MLEQGAGWFVKHGYGIEEDLERTGEAGGAYKDIDEVTSATGKTLKSPSLPPRMRR